MSQLGVTLPRVETGMFSRVKGSVASNHSGTEAAPDGPGSQGHATTPGTSEADSASPPQAPEDTAGVRCFLFLENDRKTNMPSAFVSFLKTALQKMFVRMSPGVV